MVNLTPEELKQFVEQYKGYKVLCDRYADTIIELRAHIASKDRVILAMGKRLRNHVWTLHGVITDHVLYGDDGRMDCNTCGRDYASAEPEELYDWRLQDAVLMHTKRKAARND